MRAEAATRAARTLGVQSLLLAALPANLALTVAALARGAVTPARRLRADSPLTVLVSGGKMTKALQLCRSFHRAGHRVVLVEQSKYRLTGHRFSRSVDQFHTVPRPQDPGYAAALLDIVRAESVDLYVPVCSPVASWYDALAAEALAPFCEVLHGDPETVARLDDKASFAEMVTAAGLPTPMTHRITSPEQVAPLLIDADRPYVLKSIAYDPVHRLDLTLLPLATPEQTTAFARARPISPDNPWIVQEFVTGTEFCTHGTVRDGQVQVHVCCRSSAFQVNYEHVEHPEIEQWVRTFAKAHALTGQVSFDLLHEPGGRLLAIECNPRTHSAITTLHDHPGLAAAYVDGPEGRSPVVPLPDSRPTYFAYHEAWRLLRHPASAPDVLRTILRGKDAVFDWQDPLPFLLLHHLQVPVLLGQALLRGKNWIRVDFNIGKLVEPAGD